MIRINHSIEIIAVTQALLPTNARTLLSPYDIILDCTDNAPTRYLLSDTAVLLNKPLVSGAALKYEGQLCVYNHPRSATKAAQQNESPSERGPCYRCLFPKPPSPQMASGSCEESGILGVVTGIIGNMQALETIKLIIGQAGERAVNFSLTCLLRSLVLLDPAPTLTLFSALSIPQFRSIKLRAKQKSCSACYPTKLNPIEETDYVAFCGGPEPDWEKSGLEKDMGRRISAKVRLVSWNYHR